KSARFVMEEDGRPQGRCCYKMLLQEEECRFVMEEDGRPQGRCRYKKKNARFVKEDDGRPQGSPPRIHSTPVPTISRCRFCPYIVGTGDVVWMGGDPCGRPSSLSPLLLLHHN